MANIVDESERTTVMSLESLIRLTARQDKELEDILIPENVCSSYFYTALGDEYVNYAVTKQGEPQRKILKKAKRCYQIAIEDSPGYARGKYSRKAIRLRLSYLEKNFF